MGAASSTSRRGGGLGDFGTGNPVHGRTGGAAGFVDRLLELNHRRYREEVDAGLNG
jgi:hypothetical protein